MDRSKSRIAAVMLSALACSGASKADTRALSTTGKVLTTVAAVLGAAEIANELSAVVRKKQGKELNWWNGKFSLYNLFSNSEKKQTITLTNDQKLAIQVMFKNFVNEGEEDEKINSFKNFFNGEMLLEASKEAQEGFKIFEKFLAGELKGMFVCKTGTGGIIVSKIKNKELDVKDWENEDNAVFFLINNMEDKKIRVIYNAKLMLKER